MPDRHPIADQLRRAAEAMPPIERRRFARVIAGLEGRGPRDLVPGTPFLPPITINAPIRRPRARPQRQSGPPKPAQLPLF